MPASVNLPLAPGFLRSADLHTSRSSGSSFRVSAIPAALRDLRRPWNAEPSIGPPWSVTSSSTDFTHFVPGMLTSKNFAASDEHSGRFVLGVVGFFGMMSRPLIGSNPILGRALSVKTNGNETPCCHASLRADKEVTREGIQAGSREQ